MFHADIIHVPCDPTEQQHQDHHVINFEMHIDWSTK